MTHAATSLGISPATVGRRLDDLEHALGVSLFRRGPQGAVLTPYGARIVELARVGAGHIDQIPRVADSMKSGLADAPIRVSATEPVISGILAPNLAALRSQAPDIRLELIVSTEIANLNLGEADVAVRLAKPNEPTLVARRLQEIPMGLFCSVSYLGLKVVKNIDLTEENFLWLDASYGDIPENKWLENHALVQRVVFRSTSVGGLRAAATQGNGIAPLPIFMGIGLVQLPFKLPVRKPWMVFHRDMKKDVRTRCVSNWIYESFRMALADV